MQIKKTLTSLLALWMAALVLYGGAGVNMFFYCCQECRSAGVEAILNNRCCEIHHHQHAHKHTCSDAGTCNHTVHEAKCSDVKCNHVAHTTHATAAENEIDQQRGHSCHSCQEHTSDNCCNMERIDFDWNAQNLAEWEMDLSPAVLDLPYQDLLAGTSFLLPVIHKPNTAFSNGPPLETPRDYLSVLTVLLI